MRMVKNDFSWDFALLGDGDLVPEAEAVTIVAKRTKALA